MSKAPTKSYGEMAKEAIVSLKERTGSSVQKIKATIISKYPNLDFKPVSVIFLDSIAHH
jgi:hypothetical protein